MRVDVMTTALPLRKMGPFAAGPRRAGFDGMLLTEASRTPYTAATAATLAAPGLELSTGVAVAFPRSPMITAQAAWELQEATDGSFRLGLGTQVRTHVVRRYGVEFEHPGPRLRDYVLAVKACFAGFRGEPLDHHGEFYELTFLNAQWSPERSISPTRRSTSPPSIRGCCGWRARSPTASTSTRSANPATSLGTCFPASPRVLPQPAATSTDVTVIVPALTIVGDTDEEIARGRDVARLSLSFYGSTPNYAFIWDEAGFEGTTARIREKQKAGDFAGMAAEITDEHLARVRHRVDVGRAGRRPRRQVRRHRSIAWCSTTRPATPLSASSGTATVAQAISGAGSTELNGCAIRRAVPADLDTLVALHERFCAVDGHPFDGDRARQRFAPLLDDDRHGVVWLTRRPATRSSRGVGRSKRAAPRRCSTRCSSTTGARASARR